MGSPPPVGLKKDVPAIKSKDSKINAEANTGVESKINAEVANIDQQNKGMLWISMSGIRILKIVVTKLIAPKIDAVPKINRHRIQSSSPHFPEIMLRGG